MDIEVRVAYNELIPCKRCKWKNSKSPDTLIHSMQQGYQSRMLSSSTQYSYDGYRILGTCKDYMKIN